MEKEPSKAGKIEKKPSKAGKSSHTKSILALIGPVKNGKANDFDRRIKEVKFVLPLLQDVANATQVSLSSISGKLNKTKNLQADTKMLLSQTANIMKMTQPETSKVQREAIQARLLKHFEMGQVQSFNEINAAATPGTEDSAITVSATSASEGSIVVVENFDDDDVALTPIPLGEDQPIESKDDVQEMDQFIEADQYDEMFNEQSPSNHFSDIQVEDNPLANIMSMITQPKTLEAQREAIHARLLRHLETTGRVQSFNKINAATSASEDSDRMVTVTSDSDSTIVVVENWENYRDVFGQEFLDIDDATLNQWLPNDELQEPQVEENPFNEAMETNLVDHLPEQERLGKNWDNFIGNAWAEDERGVSHKKILELPVEESLLNDAIAGNLVNHLPQPEQLEANRENYEDVFAALEQGDPDINQVGDENFFENFNRKWIREANVLLHPQNPFLGQALDMLPETREDNLPANIMSTTQPETSATSASEDSDRMVTAASASDSTIVVVENWENYHAVFGQEFLDIDDAVLNQWLPNDELQELQVEENPFNEAMEENLAYHLPEQERLGKNWDNFIGNAWAEDERGVSHQKILELPVEESLLNDAIAEDLANRLPQPEQLEANRENYEDVFAVLEQGDPDLNQVGDENFFENFNPEWIREANVLFHPQNPFLGQALDMPPEMGE